MADRTWVVMPMELKNRGEGIVHQLQVWREDIPSESNAAHDFVDLAEAATEDALDRLEEAREGGESR